MVERKCCVCGYVPEEGLEDIIQNGTCGMCSQENSADKRKFYRDEKIENKKISEVILCPSCRQKIRISIPLQGNMLRCAKCKSCFSVSIDNEGYFHVKLKYEKQAKETSTSIKIEDCFAVLDLTSNANQQEIKKAYRKKMMEYHPDKVASLGSKLRRMAKEESILINSAKAMLIKHGYL